MNYKKTAKAASSLAVIASVFLAIPAEAESYKRIQDNEGIVYDGLAYKDGIFYIDGEVNQLGEGNFHLSDGKYIKLKKINSGDNFNLYGEKYLEIENGDYYVDLNTGKIIDDNIEEDEKDDTLTNLRKEIRKDNDGRYSEDEDVRNNDIYIIENNKFLESWYYTYLKDTNSKEVMVFTDKEGNYIDADYNIGKVSLYYKKLINKNNGRVSFENTKDEKEDLKVNIYNEKVLCQDKNYIYRLAYLSIIYNDNNVISNVTTDSSITFGGYKNNNKVNTVKIENAGEELYAIPVIQKISKEQAEDDIDGAKYPKSVEIYFLTGDEGGNLETDKLLENYTVNDGKIITYGFENDKLKAYSISLRSKNGYYYTDFSDGADIDSDDVKDMDVSTDGELWILESGFIKKFNNDDDFEKVYKVDGSMNELSVYDKENILVWNEDNEIYSIITKDILNKSEEIKEENKVTDNWIQNDDGTWNYLNDDGTKKVGWVQSLSSKLWYYMNADGVMVSNCWIKDNDKWYHFNENGAMQTGWNYIDNNWYCLEQSGAMKTGWINDKGTWYYCSESGAMLHNTFVNGYYLGDNGAWTR
ncbi:cell wall binding repeat-containing protein [Clostridium carnis]|uniref:Cell wall binding repeat-containing protein n=1 Tax=Clostridium carnis TaxID=1530 RepID=A0ABY6SPG1_9CLOT|nr:N-acetylmuramoyl-L-alanine amidase family protein [Clostridium carnis]VDG69752.1 cell wall binding repeat-containing protein [Clostridium carnis]